MRIMGLDVGERTIGVAISDPLGWTAQGIEVIRRLNNPKQEIARLKELIESFEVEKIVVGLPKNMDGTLGERAIKTKDFAEWLENSVQLPIIFWDERLTTVAAQRTLIEADISRAKRKKVIDKMAAILILQGYLDSQSGC